jgi:DNA-binding CsgD family transcriptional regulator
MKQAAVAPLVGREEQLARLELFVQGTEKEPAALVLEGEAGIGKTTIWRAGVESARDLGFRVLEARAAAAERELSFAALGDLLCDVQDQIGYLPAPQRRALRIALLLEDVEGEPPEQRAIAAALLGLLRRLAEAAPVLVALDDAHWLDPPSATALQYAARRLETERIRILATRRSGASDIELEDAERLTIGPLELSALDRLIRERLGARFLRPTLRQLEEISGGNPFYALEIAGSLLRSSERVEPGDPLPIPSSLRDLVRERLTTLTPAAREAALVTAAMAQPTVSNVERAVERGRVAVAEALVAGVLEREGHALRFTHPLLAASVYEDSTPTERGALHRRLAEVVTDQEERARHLAEASEGPDDALAGALEAAASRAVARGAPDTGARLAKQALDLTPPHDCDAAQRRRLEWARLTAAAGDPMKADELLEGQLELASTGRERAEVWFELGNVRITTRGSSVARACYERALHELPDGKEHRELRVLVLLELAGTHGAELVLDSDATDRAITLAEELGQPELLARALGLHGMKLAGRGDEPNDEYWARALELERSATWLRVGGATHAFALHLHGTGDFDSGARHIDRVVESMRANGDPALAWVLQDASDVARAAGRWEEGARYAEEAYDLVVQTGRETLEPQCLLYKARFALLRGDLELARDQTEEAVALLERLASSQVALAAWDGPIWDGLAKLLGRTAAMSGHYAEAHDWFAADIDFIRQLDHVLMRWWLAEALGDDIWTLVALGKFAEAEREVAELVEIAEEQGSPIDALAARAQGIVAAARGRSTESLEQLERSLALFEGTQSAWMFEIGRTLFLLGSAQRRARKKQKARETLGRALAMFERLGARLWAEKARTELSQIGGRPFRAGALTATEQRVADLVAAGRSNAEVAHELFLSPKTVEWNLSKIYKKLHVRSRAELTAKLAKKQLLTR